MAIVTKSPIKKVSGSRAKSTTTGTGKKPASARPAARARTVKAAAPAATKPARRRIPATARATTAVAKKTVARPPVARKAVPVKKAAHQPEPLVAMDNKKGKPSKLKKGKPAKAKKGKPAKAKKAKLVRDSFTMPDVEHALIATLKKRCLDAGISVKKSEILRAAVANLAKLSDSSVLAAVRRLEVIKTGRPAKGSK